MEGNASKNWGSRWWVNSLINITAQRCFNEIKIKRKEIEKFFAEKDRDFDGRLSLEEFLGEETQIEKLFRLMDKNADGVITKKVNRKGSWLSKVNIFISRFGLEYFKAL